MPGMLPLTLVVQIVWNVVRTAMRHYAARTCQAIWVGTSILVCAAGKVLIMLHIGSTHGMAYYGRWALV